MLLEIRLPGEDSVDSAIHLRNFIAQEGITGVESVELQRAPHANGEMGAGMLLNSIATIVSAATDPLVALVRCLQKYVENYRTIIRIPTQNGDIVLEHGRGIKPDQLQELVVAIQKSKAQA